MAKRVITIDEKAATTGSLPELNSPESSSSDEKSHVSIASILHSVSKNFNGSGQVIFTDQSSSSTPPKTTVAKTFSCKSCSMTFTNNVDCLQHARVHGFLRYECSLCVSRSTTADNRNTHERLAHRLRRPDASSELIEKLSPDELQVIEQRDGPFNAKFFCLECNIAYVKNKDFVRHNQARHSAPEFSCSRCSRKLSTHLQRNQHERTSHNYVRPEKFLQSKDPVVAKERRGTTKAASQSQRTKQTAKKKNKKKSGKTPCKVVYPKIVNGVQQMTIQTDNDQQCRYCGILMGNRLNLKQHEQLHQIKTDFPCAVCGIWMKSVRRRSEHERVTHRYYRSRQQSSLPNTTVASQKSATVKETQLNNDILTPMEQLQAMLDANSHDEMEEKKPVIESIIEPAAQEVVSKVASLPDLEPTPSDVSLKTEIKLPINTISFMECLMKCPTLIYYDLDSLSDEFGFFSHYSLETIRELQNPYASTKNIQIRRRSGSRRIGLDDFDSTLRVNQNRESKLVCCLLRQN
ncbi:hypothetical protein M3Y94_01082100 [Aphelenchoides besseyi]|nr:hypothetical protein M3Y94_01082100 [Aphelenchoides besseyi]